jgi:hypothetical protein
MGSSTAPARDPLWDDEEYMGKRSLARKARRATAASDSFSKGAPGKLGKSSRLSETLSKLRRKGATT